MTDITPLIPRQKVPELSLATVDGETWSIRSASPERFTLVVVYRGLHCPICRKTLGELKDMLPKFGERGVEAIAISTDSRERASRARDEWDLGALTIGYGLDLATARQWGLYVSSGRGKTSAGIEEPARFTEPGLFLVKPDQTLYCASVQTMPFARPRFEDLIGALDFIAKSDYPARGEVERLAA